MKNNRFIYEYRRNASKLHKAVGELLRNSILFKNYEVYQEYPVNKINTSYENSSHKFDWVIPKLQLVIEAHGIQHYKPTSFGNTTAEEDISNFYSQQRRDKNKKNAAMSAGYRYIIIPYSQEKEINNTLITTLINKADIELEIFQSHQTEIKENNIFIEKQKEFKKEQYEQYKQSKQYKDKLEFARNFRRTQYNTIKTKRKKDKTRKPDDDI